MSTVGKRTIHLIALALALSACAGGNGIGTVDGPVISADQSDVGEAADIFGMLVFTDNCVLVKSVELGSTAVVWPFGTTWNGTSIQLPDGTLLKNGDFISGGGGYTSTPHQRLGSDEAVAAAERCIDVGSTGELAILNGTPDMAAPPIE